MRSLPNMLSEDEQQWEYWIQAYKPHDQYQYVSCTLNDPDARKWKIKYPGMYSPSSAIEFDDVRLAKRILSAILDAFNAGGQRKLEELRYFLGVDK